MDRNGLAAEISRGFWDGRTVLVTGASGFKGSWLCEILTCVGARVTGTVRSRSHRLSFYTVRQLGDRTDAAYVDITNARDVMDLVNTTNPSVIFHLAAKALVPVCKREPLLAYSTNLMGTLNILEACRRLQIVDKLIICSTDHVFGNPPEITEETKFNEDSPLRHSGPYDTSKAAMEMAVRSYIETYRGDLPALGITRCANVFGPGDVNQRRIIPDFIREAQTKNRIRPWYLKNRRQYIYILDAILGYIKAAERISKNESVSAFHFAIEEYKINGVTKSSVSSVELAEVVASIARKYACPVTVDESQKKADFAPGENRFQALDCTRTKHTLGWNTQFGLDDGLELTYQWQDKILKGGDAPMTFLNAVLKSAGFDL
jgi:CDP-glucose 4,6-dehydratase